MMKRSQILAAGALLGGWALGTACGARSSLEIDDVGVAPGTAGSAGAAGAGGSEPCVDGELRSCGTDVGICELGQQTCRNGVFGLCEWAVWPRDEECNELDDNCDGAVDEPFNLGAACDGADSDLCNDDVTSCEGCSLGPDDREICNGVDDNCNNIVDSDCEIGDCEPTLIVTGSTPSSPNCIDFPVTAGSEGTIQYPCAGGYVTATLGEVEFTGSVVDGVVALSGTVVLVGPDDCLWQTNHYINGVVSSGQLNYRYEEILLELEPWCWQPCWETGDVRVEWNAL